MRATGAAWGTGGGSSQQGQEALSPCPELHSLPLGAKEGMAVGMARALLLLWERLRGQP